MQVKAIISALVVLAILVSPCVLSEESDATTTVITITFTDPASDWTYTTEYSYAPYFFVDGAGLRDYKEKTGGSPDGWYVNARYYPGESFWNSTHEELCDVLGVDSGYIRLLGSPNYEPVPTPPEPSVPTEKGDGGLALSLAAVLLLAVCLVAVFALASRTGRH